MAGETKVAGHIFDDEEIAALVARARSAATIPGREAVFDELIDLYEEAATADPRVARSVTRAFLMALGNVRGELTAERFGNFLAEHVEPDDFDDIQWQNPNQVIVFCELLYGLQTPEERVASRVRAHVRHLLRQALQQFEQQGEIEKMLQLLRMAPTTPDMTHDVELLRLRNRVYLYEMRRVRRNRRLLAFFLLLQVVFIVVVFPFLFINAENGAIQRAIEETTDVDLEDGQELPQNLSYIDGLYWSLITATSIGYGDVTPRTNVGRIIAVILGVMGVITTGLLAGLILSLLVPRSLD